MASIVYFADFPARAQDASHRYGGPERRAVPSPARHWLAATLDEIEAYFAPVKVSKVPLFPQEVLGMDRLETLAGILYPEGEDPAAVGRDERPYTFEKVGSQSRVVLKMPFAVKGEVGLFKKGADAAHR